MDTSKTQQNSPNISLIGGAEAEEAHDIVSFRDEGQMPTTDNINSDQADMILSAIGSSPSLHDIAEFVGRPFPIAGAPETLASGPIKHEFVANVEDILRSSSTWNKLQGFLAFKATFCFKLVTNSNPHQQGLYMLSFFPHPKANPNHTTNYTSTSNVLYELPRLTGCPNVMHNLASTSSSELKVAYINVDPLFEIDTGVFGTIRLTSLSPLTGGTNAEKCSMRLYMWLEDLETYGARPYFPPRVQLHISMSEVKENQYISKGLDAVGDIGTAIAEIPGLGAIATPVSWIFKGAAGVARWFGFAKPHDAKASHAWTHNPFKDLAHGAGVSANFNKLTVNYDQSILVRPLGEVPDDEMAIGYLAKRPTLLSINTWTATAQRGAAIHAFDVGPSDCLAALGNVNSQSATFQSNTTLSYLAQMFQYWRGTMSYTFSIVGTKFHSGRLRFAFMPFTNDELAPTLDQINANLQYIYSTVVDIRDSDTFTIEVPYISVRPWATLYTGTMFVIVEDPLTAPAGIAQQIDIIAFNSSNDIIFAGPKYSGETQPVPGGAISTPSTSSISVSKRAITLHGPTKPVADDRPVPIDITGRKSKADHISAFKLAIGDPVLSLRVLTRRMDLYDVITSSQTSPVLNIAPDQFNVQSIPYPLDFLSRIVNMFQFRQGGIRLAITFKPDGSGATPPQLMIMPYKFGGDSPGWTWAGEHTFGTTTVSSDVNISLTVPCDISLSGSINVEIPYYATTPCLANMPWTRPSASTGLNTDLLRDEFAFMDVSFILVGRTATETRVFRGAGDDFNCGFYIGPPITYTPTPTEN